MDGCNLVYAAVFAAGCAFYAANIPITFALYIGRNGYGLGIGAFWYEGAYARAKRNGSALKKGGARKRGKAFPLRSLKSKWKLLRLAAKGVRVAAVNVAGVIGGEDAARTALLTGAVRAAALASGGKLHAEIAPDFSGGATEIEFLGIASAKLGHIIRAAVYLVYLMMMERKQNGKISEASD